MNGGTPPPVPANADVPPEALSLTSGGFAHADEHDGDAKSCGGGVSGRRVDYGPGYRLYFTRREGTVVILLCGGKKSQARDIELAQSMVSDL